ncbi:unnamed protein product [Rotaria magnacalcarata]|uniref:EF-hand domain-containing protein n=1 Tax=Rotaria magnacalcarata TaxID=392030 RepID=A0A816XRW5_9BILA|nr:unnamed protein product [Rotaria magnacalcarata]
MTKFIVKHLQTLAITSVTLTSSYFLYNHDHNETRNRILSLLKVDASNYERRNERTASTQSHFIEQQKKKLADDDDDDDEDEDEDDDKNELDKNDEVKTNSREKRFREFSSVEYNGEIYMTPLDFLESIISERPRPRIGRRQLTDAMVGSILYNTPPKHRGSKKFFRDLEDAGLISFSEYLFLWVILTKPYAQFEIAFAMFDTDGNQLVDRNEFLVLGKVMSDKRMLRRQASKGVSNTNINSKNLFNMLFNGKKKKTIKTPSSIKLDVEDGEINTTLLLHFFGKNGRDTLNFTEFKRFMENFQTELLEIEFTEFSHGFKTISDLDFAEILLRYTDFDHDTKKTILKKVNKTTIQPHGITFEQFKRFFAFLNNLEEFSIAMRFHQLSNKPISQAEFQRALKISTGFELEPNIMGLVFRIFDADGDQHLSYDEFMAVMKDRLSRGFQASTDNEVSKSSFEQFKRCFRERAKSTIKDDKEWLSLWKIELLICTHLLTMDNELNLCRVTLDDGDSSSIQERQHETDVIADKYLSSSSTSLSGIDDEHKQQFTETPTTTIKTKRTKWHVYDTVAKFLLKNRFYLTALEFYTELLENGYDLPRLREYFSNPANFEGSSATSINKQSTFIRNLNHYADDSVSLGGGGNGDFFPRTSSSQTFDSTSIDNITRYSEDIDWHNGNGSGGAATSASVVGESRFNDERVAVLEFELRKARDTIQELRQTLTYDSTDEQQQQLQNKKSDDRNAKHQAHLLSSNSTQALIPTGLTVRPFERRALNYLVNEYLLTNNYKLTSVTFGEENDTSDLEDWDSVGLNCSRPPDLTQLYRWYYYQLCIEDEKPKKEDFSMLVNFDENLYDEYKKFKTIVHQMQFDVVEYNKRINHIEQEKLNLNEEIQALQHEKKNLLIQLQLLQNRLTSDATSNLTKMEDTIQLNSSRQLPQVYRCAFERHLLSCPIHDDKQDEEMEINHDFEQKAFEDNIHELNILSLDQKDLLDLIVRTMTKINSNLNGSKKLDLVPLITYTSILHPKNDERDRLLKTLFNLYKNPSYNQRQVVLHAFLCFAKQSGPLRVHAELLPQCWENISNKIDERRCLVAEACGILTPHLPKDIRVSLIFSMLQQMLVEDKCDQVRSVCSKSLAMVINEIDDETRLSQCIELLDRCLSDTSDVVQSAKKYLLSSIAMWCLELNKVFSVLIDHYLSKIESLVLHIQTPSSTDSQRFIQLIYILTDLIVFIFASALQSMKIDHDLSQSISSARTLPDTTSSVFFQLHTILSPNSEKLLDHYDQCAINGEFPFTDQIEQYIDVFLKRSFDTIAATDMMNGKVIHACSEFIKTISRYFGRNFWKLKIKPLYTTSNSPTSQDEIRSTKFVLYATGVLCSWTTEQERAELTQYIYDALLLIANQKLSINTLQAMYSEIGTDANFQDILLSILRDSLTNTNPQVRLYTLQLFNITLGLVDHSTISHKILPALITLASDDDITVRTATIQVFGSILIRCSESEILERVYAQFQIFDTDPAFRDEHRVQSEFIKTFTQIAPHAESKFREEFILPFLAFIASQNSQQQSERGQAKRLEIATYLFEAYSALSCCFHSGQSILNSFLPGLYCLRVDFAQLRPDSVAVLDSIIKDLEHKLEQYRQDSSLLIGGTNLNQENIRGRMLKGLTNFRDSTEKLTYRFIKKK